MTVNGWIQILFFFAAIVAVTMPLGAFMHRVLEGQDHFLRPPLGWLERLMYRARRAWMAASSRGRSTASPSWSSASSRCS